MASVQNPVFAAGLLDHLIQKLSSASERLELLEKSGEEIEQITAGVLCAEPEDGAQAMVSLSHATDASGPLASARVARLMLAAIKAHDALALGAALAAAVRDGSGARLGIELGNHLRAVGKPVAARQVENEVEAAMKDLQNEFTAAHRRFDEASVKIANLRFTEWTEKR